ncbi:TolC family protein [Mucilaginibacter sp.]|uniref:TolC family protein n=1 Tax=Mucilaginibacter sp. TaxID=1882438 RepID=UPI003D0EEF32
MDNIRVYLFAFCLFCLPSLTDAQTTNQSNMPPVVQPDTSKNTLMMPLNPQDTGKNGSGQFLTLQQCIEYAMQHQPALNKALINVNITKETNSVNLSGLLPQASASGDFIHYLQQSNNNSSSVSTGTPTGTGTTSTSTTRSGYTNTFIPGVSVTQSIFNPSLLYAYKSAPLYLKQAQQVTDSTKIFLVSSVSKSFYNVLLTLEQINVFKEDTTRLGKNLRDAYHQYKGGIVDETDYEEAAITLNNSKAQLKQATENVVPQYAALKQLMGYPVEKEFNVSFDTVQMIKGIYIDTTQQLQYEKRIEFQQIKTSKDLQTQLVNYYRTSYLPTLSAFYNYNLAFENNKFSDILSNSYPSQLVGLSFSIPIFTGFSRIHNLKKAKLQQQIIGWDETDLKLQINKEYRTALANYKGNYYNLQLLQKNVAMAKRVYFVVTLQYKQGIVPYLNVITAESNLITSEISYLNALFQVLSNKIDLEKAMGSINY